MGRNTGAFLGSVAVFCVPVCAIYLFVFLDCLKLIFRCISLLLCAILNGFIL